MPPLLEAVKNPNSLPNPCQLPLVFSPHDAAVDEIHWSPINASEGAANEMFFAYLLARKM